MFRRLYVSFRRVIPGAFLVCGAMCGYPSIGRAQAPARAVDEHFIPCGRARSLMARYPTGRIPPRDTALMETLAETDIHHYSLDIEVTNLDPVGNTCTITGTNVMTIQSKTTALDEFTFRLWDHYTITQALENDSTPVTITTPSETTRVASLNSTYGMDEIFTLTIAYTGNTSFLSGVDSSVRVKTHSDGIPVVGTLSQPYFAYTWWPVKEGDDGAPGDATDKFTMDFAITVQDTFNVPSNGLLQGVDVLSGNRKRYRWASNYPNIPSLVSFAATEYNTWTQTYTYPGGTMPVEFYIYPESDTPEHRAAWEKSIVMIETFASLFGEYPFVDEKYGIYQFPFAGLEHQTMSGQGAEWGYTGFDEYLTEHELVHQWWGDAVSCKTWNHIWISEGFASYADALWEEFKPGGGGLPAAQAMMSWRREVLNITDGSVYVRDEELGDMWEIFSTATYYKGAWVLHMLRRVLGEDDFFAALVAFYNAFEFSAATTEDFQAVCEGFYGGSMEWFFQQWIYGEGMPVYSWGWDSVVVNGSDYLLLAIDQSQGLSYPRFTMPIDIEIDSTTYVVHNDTDPQFFVIPLASAPTTVEFDPDVWLLWDSLTQVSYFPGPPKVVETSPAPGEEPQYLDVIDSVVISFQTSVEATEGDILLMGTVTGPKSFSITSDPGGNPVVMDLSGLLLPDTYTLTVTTGVTAVDSGMILDGELVDAEDPASLPSGDGSPGGDAVIRFTVTSPYLPGDFDDNDVVDGNDVPGFMGCYTGPGGGPVEGECQIADFDLDGDVDCDDWELFASLWSGPGDPPLYVPCDGGAIPAVSDWGMLALALLVAGGGAAIIRTRRGALEETMSA